MAEVDKRKEGRTRIRCGTQDNEEEHVGQKREISRLGMEEHGRKGKGKKEGRKEEENRNIKRGIEKCKERCTRPLPVQTEHVALTSVPGCVATASTQISSIKGLGKHNNNKERDTLREGRRVPRHSADTDCPEHREGSNKQRKRSQSSWTKRKNKQKERKKERTKKHGPSKRGRGNCRPSSITYGTG